MTVRVPPPPGPSSPGPPPPRAPFCDVGSVARTMLAALSEAFSTGDLAVLMEQFSSSPTATYAGSETGEIATGQEALAQLLSGLLTRPERYRFEFDDVRAREVGPVVWLVADGWGHEQTPQGPGDSFPYRITGVLVREQGAWRWAMLCGAEPIHSLS